MDQKKPHLKIFIFCVIILVAFIALYASRMNDKNDPVSSKNTTPLKSQLVAANINAIHPADANADYFISASESESYYLCYKTACAWGNSSSPITSDYANSAVFISKFGGTYHFDSSESCPKCWASGKNTLSISSDGGYLKQDGIYKFKGVVKGIELTCYCPRDAACKPCDKDIQPYIDIFDSAQSTRFIINLPREKDPKDILVGREYTFTVKRATIDGKVYLSVEDFVK